MHGRTFKSMPGRSVRTAALVVLGRTPGWSAAAAPGGHDWPMHGADAAGTRFSPLAQINRDNVRELEIAWTYRTGEMARRGAAFNISKEQNVPITVAGHLILCTPFNSHRRTGSRTGVERWVYDPHVDMKFQPPATYACRGVAAWHDPQVTAGAPCRDRLLVNTNDLRLIAIDARTGVPCAGFRPQWHGVQSGESQAGVPRRDPLHSTADNHQ